LRYWICANNAAVVALVCACVCAIGTNNTATNTNDRNVVFRCFIVMILGALISTLHNTEQNNFWKGLAVRVRKHGMLSQDLAKQGVPIL
jgi:DMSO reductase anchor subunit